ncbi:tetratricopeptide repeat protein 39C-like isoform X2 [Actinia tenebrosa]|uniref:Tetratricopeptide repeat protein 39C-like isoform X2 n=1 Tax=Actinia tenebrosa TaxID=6105 RepID=A0A6P8HD05_ACTTE|nr:tetratricopeptide repeat protein 39C-like isoform X2 [Actinia tenebrosa]
MSSSKGVSRGGSFAGKNTKKSEGFWGYHSLARDGINLLLNNGFEESQKLFKNHSDGNPLMSAGSGMVDFVQAILTFEDDQLDRALENLKKSQRVCYIESSKKSSIAMDERLMRQILYADSELYMALLTFLKQGITDYIKGGYLMRRAWKLYDKCYREISEIGGPFLNWSPEITVQENGASDADAEEVPDLESTEAEEQDMLTVLEEPSSAGTPSLLRKASKEIGSDKLRHLQAAVSCGYGLFHLAISLVPPKLLKFCHLLGFSGNRDVGLQALDIASRSDDMKAPVARLTLLWYHSVIRPFIALDEGNNEEGLLKATQMLEESSQDYPSSAVFLFFRGLVSRLKGNVPLALQEFHQAMHAAAEQTEIALICQYEIGWCHLLQLEWDYALPSFFRLKEESKWSQGYYAYLCGVTIGLLGSNSEAQTQFKSVLKLVKKKTPLEEFLFRRASQYKKIEPSEDDCLLMALELLYVWRAFYSCSQDVLHRMARDLEGCRPSSNLIPLKILMQGSVFQILKNNDMAVKYFQEAIHKSGRSPPDSHVPPFATYELGVLYAQDTRTSDKGEELLRRVKDNYNGYDFENRLSFRIHAAMARIEERKLESASSNLRK